MGELIKYGPTSGTYLSGTERKTEAQGNPVFVPVEYILFVPSGQVINNMKTEELRGLLVLVGSETSVLEKYFIP